MFIHSTRICDKKEVLRIRRRPKSKEKTCFPRVHSRDSAERDIISNNYVCMTKMDQYSNKIIKGEANQRFFCD